MATYSIEMLTHFNCSDPECARWWSIGDYVLEMNPLIFCPWCGLKQDIKHCLTPPA